MNKSSNMIRNLTRLFVFIVSLTLIGADLIVSASGQEQNTNSGTTMSQNDNTTSTTTTTASRDCRYTSALR